MSPVRKITLHLFGLILVLSVGISPVRGASLDTNRELPCDLSINLLKFDALLGDIDARINLKMPPSEINEQFSPKRTYFLVDELTVTESILPIKSTVPFSSFDNFLPTKYQVDDAGTEFLYPFDHHSTELKIFVEHQDAEGSPASRMSRVPLRFDTNLCAFEGYDVALTLGKENSPVFIDMIVDLRRTTPIRVFSIFMAFLMLLVAGGVFVMAIRVVRSPVAPEIGLLGFSAALLFAFPAIRNSQPLVPPMGVLSDYLGFFWAESIVAISLIILLVCWIRRKVHV